MFTIPLNGGPTSSFTLAAPLRRTMHDTGGVPTCYVVAAMSGAAITGASDVLCALPGSAALSGAIVTSVKQAAQTHAFEQALRAARQVQGSVARAIDGLPQ